MKGCLKFFLGILFIAFILLGSVAIYITRGLDEGKNVYLAEVDFDTLEDGSYNGYYSFGRWSNEVKVDVFEGKIVDVFIIKDMLIRDSRVSDEIISKVISKQNLNVDAVSGATVSSKSYLKSIENALVQQ